MVQETESRRAQRTKNLFKNALAQLLQTESFAYITVKEIVHTADFNRATFYKHYLDKDDLLQDFITDLVNGLAEATEQSFRRCRGNDLSSLRETDVILFQYVYRNKEAFRLWSRAEFAAHITMCCLTSLEERLVSLWRKQGILAEAQISTISKALTCQIVGMLYYWLSNDFSAPAETLTKEFVDFYRYQKG